MENKRVYHWGIIGTGRIAESFSKALAYETQADLYGVASRSLTKAQSFADTFHFSHAYGSYEEMAKDPAIDVIYIATPMSCHYENAKMCLAFGKAVLLEKSVTLNAEQFEELVALAHEKQVFFMEAMWMKFLPAFQKALVWKNEGRLGKLQMIKADFCNAVPLAPQDRLFDKALGGGALLDLSVYTLSFATAFLGTNPDQIFSHSRTGATGADFDNAMLLSYGDAFAVLTAGFDILCQNNATIIGENARIEFGNWFFCTGDIKLVDDCGKEIEAFHHDNECNGYEYEIREVQHCLASGLLESAVVPLKDTLAVMRLLDACRLQWEKRSC